MTGAIPVLGREKLQKQFQEDEATEVILLTIAVGGVSLNLTAASHVIHCDRCYNPAKGQQANDRAHRFRQYQSVCVHTLVTSGTFEECLDDIMIEKAELPNLATSAEDWSTNYCHDNFAEIEQDSFEECIGRPCFGNDLAKPVLRLAKQFSTRLYMTEISMPLTGFWCLLSRSWDVDENVQHASAKRYI